MNMIRGVVENITGAYQNPVLGTKVVLAVLVVVLLLSIYEFAVYRLVSHRAFYNRSFQICVSILPFFIATIILCLQSNIVVTLGTIGALAILRFRTAVKDPVDMLYLLWSVHIGITCGCQLYEVAVLTALIVTILLLVMEHFPAFKKPYLLVMHADTKSEKGLLAILTDKTKRYRVKSRNYTEKGLDLVIELSVQETEELASELKNAGAEKIAIIAYDSEDIL